jgi:hypothetical protein
LPPLHSLFRVVQPKGKRDLAAVGVADSSNGLCRSPSSWINGMAGQTNRMLTALCLAAKQKIRVLGTYRESVETDDQVLVRSLRCALVRLIHTRIHFVKIHSPWTPAASQHASMILPVPPPQQPAAHQHQPSADGIAYWPSCDTTQLEHSVWPWLSLLLILVATDQLCWQD